MVRPVHVEDAPRAYGDVDIFVGKLPQNKYGEQNTENLVHDERDYTANHTFISIKEQWFYLGVSAFINDYDYIV